MRHIASLLLCLACTALTLRSNRLGGSQKLWNFVEKKEPSRHARVQTASAAHQGDEDEDRINILAALAGLVSSQPTNAFVSSSPVCHYSFGLPPRSLSGAASLRPMDRRVRTGTSNQKVTMLDAVAAESGKELIGGVSSESVLRPLFDGIPDPDAIAAACSEDVVWEDLSRPDAAVGRDAVRDLITSKFPEGTSLRIDRISDGRRSGGFTWYRQADEQIGLRGTLFAELDEAGQITYIREGCEPLFKPGEATEKLLKAATKNMKAERKKPTYTPAVPRSASGLVQYLWQEAYPKGATPDEALKFFADDIVYEDFNYPEPFVGKPAVTEFVNAFDFPGIEFIPLKISEGERGCAFAWKVKVNDQDGPSGISFYEVNEEGKVTYIRDIPAPFGPSPLASLAAILQPQLRVFQPRTKLW